jgi:hypothetical protein
MAICVIAFHARIQLVNEKAHQGIQRALGKGDVLVSLFFPKMMLKKSLEGFDAVRAHVA